MPVATWIVGWSCSPRAPAREALARAVPQLSTKRESILMTLAAAESWAIGDETAADVIRLADQMRMEVHDGHWRVDVGKVGGAVIGYMMRAAAKSATSVARPSADSSLAVLCAAGALSLRVTIQGPVHYVNQEQRKLALALLADVVRSVIPFPRQGTALAWCPGAIVYRTAPGRLGLQLAPRERPSHKNPKRAPVWWDGWIEGPIRDVLDSIPDPDLLRTVLEQESLTIWPSSSRSNATSISMPLVASSSAT
jgi:hypothetical protein